MYAMQRCWKLEREDLIAAKNAALEGIKEAVPIVLGYVPLGFAFGVLANETGMSILKQPYVFNVFYRGGAVYCARY